MIQILVRTILVNSKLDFVEINIRRRLIAANTQSNSHYYCYEFINKWNFLPHKKTILSLKILNL